MKTVSWNEVLAWAGKLQSGETLGEAFHWTCDGRELVLRNMLRLLPGARLTASAEMDGQAVIVKLFLSSERAQREAEDEAVNLFQLAEAGLNVPPLLYDSGVVEGGRLLVLGKLPGRDALTCYRAVAGTSDVDVFTARLVSVTEKLHRNGCMQIDMHLGNFMINGGEVYLLDVGSIKKSKLSRKQRWKNLAVLFAQFYPEDLMNLSWLLSSYSLEPVSDKDFQPYLDASRQYRYRKALKKTERDCSDFFSLEKGCLRGMANRDWAEEVRSLLDADLDQLIFEGDLLKDGNSSTVSRIKWQGSNWVVKRYNIKDALHLFRRQWKISRARRCWHNGWWLRTIGVPTPRPVAYFEERSQGLLRRGYFISEHVEGVSLERLLGDPDKRSAIDDAIATFFYLMRLLKFSHGDMKATNFLWSQERLFVLDLDGMQRDLSFHKANVLIMKDKARWLKNISNNDSER